MARSGPSDGPAYRTPGEAAGPAEDAPPGDARRDGMLLAELLVARLCHELSGPAGTLAGAVEIARIDPGSTAEALAIAADAATALTAHLQLRRAAWAGVGEALDAGGLRKLCAGLPDQVVVDTDALPAGQSFAPEAAHVLLNVLLLAAESLPKGGVVILGGAGRKAASVALRGRNAGWPAGLAAWMADPASAWHAAASATPRQLQGPLTALLADRAGVRLCFDVTGGEAVPPVLLHLAG